MAFTIYHSNHLDSLQYMASYLIQQNPLENPLLPEYFIIHSSGMTNWLKSALAEEHNIFANTKLEFPINQIVTMIENLLTEEERAKTNLRISRLTLTWAVFDVLKNSSLADLEILTRYLSTDHTEHSDVRMMALAEEIAGLLDKYLAYRPDWFEAWRNNQLLLDDSLDELWQQKIWQEICQKVIPQYYLANIGELLKIIPEERYQHPKIPTRLFVIGISTLPPLFIDLLHTLSKHIDVHLFFTNPSQFYWGDLTQYRNREIQRIIFESSEAREEIFAPNINQEELEKAQEISEQWLEFHGNPLLASFGKIGRDFIHLLSQYDDVIEIEAFSEPDNSGLLGHVQREIFNLAAINKDSPKYIVTDDDNSISFHAHYSERREVEGLYDQLLHAFNNDVTLEPKDIIVMVSDVDRYRPMIEAVFGAPFSADIKIPYTISDFTLGKHEPILEAFLLLLSIPESHFTISELLTLLEIPEIAERFSISQNNRHLIRQWVENSHIKFGIDQEHLSELNIRAEPMNTWLWGLKRLLLGYSLNEAVEIDDVLAFPYIQGGDAITLGHLVDFVDALIHWKQKLSQSYSLNEWRTVLNEIWSSFYIDNDATQFRLQHLQFIWNSFLDEGEKIKFDQPISIHLIYRYLNEHLSSFRPESRFLTGSVNFCTFIPMRSIPFKIVCMLGMNQDSFPHRKQYPEYDLMQKYPARGDRSTVNDERYLFLEAILSAKSQLYISYIGKNIHNNSEMFPSLFVNELQHYLDELAETSTQKSVTQQLTIHHPLSSYSPLLFQQNSRVHSFQKVLLPSLCALDDREYQSKIIDLRKISTKMLIDAFKDPLKVFSIQHFGINFYRQSINEIEDDEVFALSERDALENYQARVQLIEELFYNDISDDLLHHYAKHQLFQQYKLEGKLPKFAFAKLDWYAFIEPIVQMVLTARANHCCYGIEQPIQIIHDNIMIDGTVVGIDHDQQCLVFAGKFHIKRQFEALITHVLNTLRLQQNITTKIFFYDNKKVYETMIEPIDMEYAKSILHQLIIGYQENLVSPFILASENALRAKDKKLLQKHVDFILKTYHDYQTETVQQYLMEHTEFRIEIIDRILEDLMAQDSMLIDRFMPTMTEKEVIGYLYFYLRYINLICHTKIKELKSC
ncbi:exodeoxyribonuclease V subunit gamma [Wohlfahrtiimonas larvae]|uniref:RecBCD enzyme subunit RecC n=1 Tax=Wohlfahrtiimonas larvae TaxID=1157986 RepID=A0ABP9MVS1_9GAMM|nr:exodeoxyribonuclease V subunit gamma [Wohlfahrtiimonas larvae]